MSTIFDRTLIDPSPEDLDALFPEAVAAANAKYRIKIIQFPFPKLGDFLHRFLTTPEGMHGWHGGTKPDYYEGRSQVIILWWSDRLKRKHVRLLGGSGGSLCMRINYSFGRAYRRTPASLSPLEQIYPKNVARLRHGESEPTLIAVCDCGAVGTPTKLGWMGTCCGPCHDRRQDGAAPPALTLHPNHVCRDVAFSPDSRTLAFASGGLCLYDLQTGSLERPLDSGDDAPWDLVRFSPDGKQLILYCDRRGEPFVTVFDLDKKKTLRHALPKSHFSSFEVSPNARTFAVAWERGLEIRSTKDGAVKQTINAKKVSGLAFSPDGKRLAVAAYDQPLRIFNPATGAQLGKIPDDFHASTLAFSPDGKLLCGTSLSNDGRVWLADPSGKTTPSVEVPPRDSFSWCGFAPQGRVFATGCDDGVLSLWNLDRPDAGRLEVQWGRNTLLAVGFSPDGQWLASGGGEGIRLWPYPALRQL